MSKQFSNLLFNLMHNGKSISLIENKLLEILFQNLPDFVFPTINEQFKKYNLLQREIDFKETNFYRIKKGKVFTEDFPKLKTNKQEFKLMEIKFRVNKIDDEYIAEYWVVNNLFFCISFNKSIKKILNEIDIEIISVEKSDTSIFTIN
jgi:hypothetical protein